MKKLSAFAVALFLALAAIYSPIQAQTVVPFYIIIGQSNTGWTSSNSMSTQQAAAYGGTIANTQIWNPGVGSWNAVWQPMTVGTNTRCENYADPTQFGPEASLLKSLQNKESKKRFVYKQGVGGTTLSNDWRPQLPGQYLYEAGPRWQQFVAWLGMAVAQANTNGFKLDLRAVIWMQGEDDAKTLVDGAAYLANLTYFFNSINNVWKEHVTNYSLPNTSYKKVIGRIYAPTAYPYRELVRTAQAEYCANPLNNAVLINTDSYPLQDWVHYNATGQIQFGLDIFNAAQYEAAAAAAPAGVYLSGKVLLQGAYNRTTASMSNALNSSGVLKTYALTQPYNTSVFNHTGAENVSSTFFAANPTIVDWILLELRSASDPSVIIARRAAFVKTDGTLVETDGSGTRIFFSGITSGNYFLAIKHRNHLGIRSALAIDFTSGTGTYDFTLSAAKVFQNQSYTSQVQIGSVWVMRGGNANFNNNVKYSGPLNDQDRIQNIALAGSLSIVVNNVYAYDDINMDANLKTNGPNNDQNFLLNTIFGGFFGSIFMEQL